MTGEDTSRQQDDGPSHHAMLDVAPEVSVPDKSSSINILDLYFQDVTLNEAADTLVTSAMHGIKQVVLFVNAHCINIAANNKAYYAVLCKTPLLYADGIGMAIAARIWGSHLRNNINGTDLFPLICESAAKYDVPIALLGSRPGVAKACAERMHTRYPDLHIVWAHHGYYPKEDDDRIIREINQSGARILLVAKGVPSQEIWIDDNASKIETPLLMGVGALFDFYSGSVKRAPLFVRKLRMEWLFRLLIEPQRLFARYVIGNPVFLIRTLKRRFVKELHSKPYS